MISTKILIASCINYLSTTKKPTPERYRWVSNSGLTYSYCYRSILNIVCINKLILIGKEKEQNNKNNRSQCCHNYKSTCLHSSITVILFIKQFILLTTYEIFYSIYYSLTWLLLFILLMYTWLIAYLLLTFIVNLYLPLQN